MKLNLLTLSSALLVSTVLIACGGDSEEEPPVTTTNQAPTITISSNSSVSAGELISLNANASDTDGTIASISWSVNTGDGITLNGADSKDVSFTAPNVDIDTTITITVLVTDNDGATATQSTLITILSTKESVTITGVVTDSIISNAAVEVSISGQTFSTIADENGKYTITITVDESLLNQLVKIRALGDSSINPEVEFISQLGSLSSLIDQAGADGNLTSDDSFGVNVTNVTTAEYALITQDGTTPTTDTELTEAISSLNTDEKNTLAALIKIVVDNDDFSLPNGVTSTLDLVDDTETATDFEQEVTLQAPTLITETISTIVNDNTLTGEASIVGSWKVGSDVITFSRSGHYVHITTEVEEGSDGKIGYEVGSYTWNEETGSLSFTTTEDSNNDSGLHDEVDEPLNTKIAHVATFTVSGDTLTIDEGDDVFNATRLASSTNPLVGGFYLERTNFSDDLSMRITLDDNKFIVVLKSDSTALPVGTSYLYLMREYSYDAQSLVHTRLSQKVYVDGNVISENTGEISSLVNMQGDVIAFVGADNTASFIKNSYTTTTQIYLTENTLIGDFKGAIDDSFTFNATFNTDGTGQASSQEGESSFEWKLVFGQLLFTYEDTSLQVWSPTNLDDENNRVFNVNQYNEGSLEHSSGGTLAPSESAIVGTWTASGGQMFSITFTDDGRYVHMEEDGPTDDCGSAGYEVGTYEWNEFTGSVTVTTTQDTNGCVGLHEESPLDIPFELDLTIQIVDGSMVVTDTSGEVSTLSRVISDTNPLVGAYYEGDLGGDFFLMVLEDNGTFMELAHDSDEVGITAGTYNWDSSTTLFDFTSITLNQISSTRDQNIVSVQGDVLIWKDGEDAGVMKRTHKSTDQPYLMSVNQILGSFTTTNDQTLTFNSNFTGTTTETGTGSFEWSIEIGQLIIDYNDEITVLSPTVITLNTLEFSGADFDLIDTPDGNEIGQVNYTNDTLTRN